MAKKITVIAFGLAFLIFLALQYNDPDPEIWMSIYGLAALVCFLAAFNKINHSLVWIAVIMLVAGGIYTWPQKYEGLSVGGGDIKNIEEARESLGLILIALVFTGFILWDKLKLKAQRTAALKQKAKWA